MPPTSSPAAYRPGIGASSISSTCAGGVDLQPAEREGDAAADRIGFERRLLHRVGPVGLVDREPDGAPPSLMLGSNGTSRFTAALYSRMVLRNCAVFTSCMRVASSSSVSAVHLGRAAHLVFVAHQVLDLRVEDLPGVAARLLQDDAAVFRVGDSCGNRRPRRRSACRRR